MKLDHPILYKLAALAGSTAVRAWMDTLDYRVVFYDPDVDPASPRCRGQKIYVFWHEYILFPLAMRGHCNLAMLLSRHRDAEVLSYVAYHMGFEFVRGSTNRGGVAALRQLLGQEPAHAPGDHARRPPRTAAANGPRTDLPGLETGNSAGGHGRGLQPAVAGRELGPLCRPAAMQPGPMHSLAGVARPARTGSRGMEHFRLKVEQLLNRLCGEAEQWAEAGSRKPGQLTPQRAVRAACRQRQGLGWLERVGRI